MLEDNLDEGMEGGVRREEPLVRDWVVCQQDEEEDKKSDASVSNGSSLHCASVWIPFSPFVYRGTKKESNIKLSKQTTSDNLNHVNLVCLVYT